jgi:hypothetical protein
MVQICGFFTIHLTSYPSQVVTIFNFYERIRNYYYNYQDYAVVSITPRLITSSTSHLGFFHDRDDTLSFRGFEFTVSSISSTSSASVSEPLNVSLLSAFDGAIASPAMPDENLSWRTSPTSSHARSNRSRSSFV